MKKSFLLLSVTTAFAGSTGAQIQSALPRLWFQQAVQPADTLVEGIDKLYSFAFENAGTTPVLLEALTNCGCTVAQVPATPVLPGKAGIVTVVYHTAHRPGPFVQTILLRCAPAGKSVQQDGEEHLLKIQGLVLPAAPRR